MTEPTDHSEAPSRGKWELIILVTMYAGYASMMLCRNTLNSASAAMVNDPLLGLDKESYGQLVAYNTLGAVLGKFVSGIAADRLGGRKTFILAVGLTACSTLLFGMMSSFFLFAALNFSAQFFKSGGWPALAKLIGDWYPASKHGRIWSVISTSSRIGTIAAGLVTGAVLSVAPWRWAFVVTSGCAFIAMAAAWFYLKSSPRAVGLSPPTDSGSGDTGEVGPHPLDGTSFAQGCLAFAKSPRVWLICFGLGFLTILMDFIYFLPLFLNETIGLGDAASSATSVFFPGGMFVALIATGFFYDRLSKMQITWVVGGLMVLCILCVGFLWGLPRLGLPEDMKAPVAVATIFVMGFALSPAYYLPMSVFAIAFGGKHSGFLIALIDIFGYLVALPFNYFGGGIAQDHGWPVFLGLLLGVAFTATGLMVVFLFLDARASGAKEQTA